MEISNWTFSFIQRNARSLQISISTSISFFFVCACVFVLLVYATDVVYSMKKNWKVVFESWVRQFFRFKWNGTFASKIAHYRDFVLHFKRQRNRNEQFPLNLNSVLFLSLSLSLSVRLLPLSSLTLWAAESVRYDVQWKLLCRHHLLYCGDWADKVWLSHKFHSSLYLIHSMRWQPIEKRKKEGKKMSLEKTSWISIRIGKKIEW